jgi:hypothetical protein
MECTFLQERAAAKRKEPMNTVHLRFAAALALTISTLIATAPATAQGSKPITFGKTKTYTYEENLFSIEYPSAWKFEDRSKESESGDIVVQFVDKTGFAALRVDVGDTDEEWTAAELASGLTRVIKSRYSDMKKYSASTAKKLDASHASLNFKFEFNKTAMTGDAIMSYAGNRIAVVALVMPTDQYAKNKKASLALLDSFRLATTASELITELEGYEHPNGAFAISYPTGWTVDDRSENEGEVVVVFENPDGVSFVMVEVYKTDGDDLSEEDLIAKLDETVATAIEKNVENYEGQDAEGSDDAASKVFTFTITDKDKNEIPVVGVMLLQEHGDAYSYLRIVLPVEFADANSDKLDEIGDSFKVDPSAEF